MSDRELKFNPCEGERAICTAGVRVVEPVTLSLESGYLERPDWAQTTLVASGGLFGRSKSQMTAADAVQTDAYSVNVSWKQLRPTVDGGLNLDVEGLFRSDPIATPTLKGSWNEQVAGSERFWVRFYTGHINWAPEWVIHACSEPGRGGEPLAESGAYAYLPLWNECVWGHLRDTYAMLAAELRDNDRFIMMYVPGIFRYSEYGLGVLKYAAQAGRWTKQSTRMVSNHGG